MTSPDPADLGRAPRHAESPDDDMHALTPTKLDGMRECGGSCQPMPESGMSVDRLALALLLIAVFVAVPLGLLALQAA